jgi:hypothetical protein
MGEDLVEVTFVGDEVQAAMIQALLEQHEIPSIQEQVGPRGPQLGYGLVGPGGGSRRVMVHAHRVEEARALLADATADGEREAPESVNARYLEEGSGRRLRDYGIFGAYARMFAVSVAAIAAMALAFAIFMLLRAV